MTIPSQLNSADHEILQDLLLDQKPLHQTGVPQLKRLFAFGCSFTNYRWSTWADCLAPEFDEFQNWGQSGAGNHYIFNSVMEADQRQSFAAGDTVVVCWTSFTRDDRYVDGLWHTLGNIFNCPIYEIGRAHV